MVKSIEAVALHSCIEVQVFLLHLAQLLSRAILAAALAILAAALAILSIMLVILVSKDLAVLEAGLAIRRISLRTLWILPPFHIFRIRMSLETKTILSSFQLLPFHLSIAPARHCTVFIHL